MSVCTMSEFHFFILRNPTCIISYIISHIQTISYVQSYTHILEYKYKPIHINSYLSIYSVYKEFMLRQRIYVSIWIQSCIVVLWEFMFRQRIYVAIWIRSSQPPPFFIHELMFRSGQVLSHRSLCLDMDYVLVHRSLCLDMDDVLVHRSPQPPPRPARQYSPCPCAHRVKS